MTRRRIGSIFSIVLAVAGAAILVLFVRGADERARAGQNYVDILVVSGGDDIAAGTPIEEMALDLVPIPASVVVRDAIADRVAATGLVNIVDLVPGEQLLWSRLGEADEILPDELLLEPPDASPLLLPEGYLEVTIPIDADRALGGRLVPGETVAIVASFDGAADPEDPDGAPDPTEPAPELLLALPDPGSLAFVEPIEEEVGSSTHVLLHHVLITAIQAEEMLPDPADQLVGDDEDGDEKEAAVPAISPFAHLPAPAGGYLISFALQAPDIERVVYAAQYGSLWLARESEDTDGSGTKVQRADSIYTPVLPIGDSVVPTDGGGS